MKLQPGDVLLYNRNTVFNWIIKVKTVSRFTHVEVVVASEQEGRPARTFAARNGEGCAYYDFEPEGLALVLRPSRPFDLKKATEWIQNEHIWRQGYDWMGLLNFTYARFVGRENGKMFCSELATRLLRRGGVPVFEGHDADCIAPKDFSLTSELTVEWRSPDERERFKKWLRYQEEL